MALFPNRYRQTDLAAESVVRAVEEEFSSVQSANQWCEVLKPIDHRIGVGESTAVVVDVRPYGIAGASVGDSEAWIVHSGDVPVLTEGQRRKPLLGSDRATPEPFTCEPLRGLLIVGTDGFFNYAKRESITPMVSQPEFFSIPRRCVEMVRLPSGDLWDDIGVVVARVPQPRRDRKRYDIQHLRDEPRFKTECHPGIDNEPTVQFQ